jgi:hypothetical protein
MVDVDERRRLVRGGRETDEKRKRTRKERDWVD